LIDEVSLPWAAIAATTLAVLFTPDLRAADEAKPATTNQTKGVDIGRLLRRSKAALPKVADQKWSRDPIDKFILARWRLRGSSLTGG